MSGPIALVGAGASLSSLPELCRGLLAATGRVRPRVVILAAGATADAAPSWAATSAADLFRGLGSEVEMLDVPDRIAADDPSNAQALGEADVIVVFGATPVEVLGCLLESAAWRAAEDATGRGAVLIGCGAGAVAFGERAFDLGIRRGWPAHWATGLAAVEDIVILPEYDRRPEPVMALLAMGAPGGMAAIGIDREAAIVGRQGAWQVHGGGRVTVWQGRHRMRHRRGDTFLLPDRFS
jgi:cyanophycinase-like exopeptidase